MPFVTAPVPGAQPAPAPIAGAQLFVPKGAGVAPGVDLVGVSAPGVGTVLTPVVPVGELAVGVVDGYGTEPPGNIGRRGHARRYGRGVAALGGLPGAVPTPAAVPAVPAAKPLVPAQATMKQPVAKRRPMRRVGAMRFMSALLYSAKRLGAAVDREREARPRVAPKRKARARRRAPDAMDLKTLVAGTGLIGIGRRRLVRWGIARRSSGHVGARSAHIGRAWLGAAGLRLLRVRTRISGRSPWGLPAWL